jgi:hypothetical protein
MPDYSAIAASLPTEQVCSTRILRVSACWVACTTLS